MPAFDPLTPLAAPVAAPEPAPAADAVLVAAAAAPKKRGPLLAVAGLAVVALVGYVVFMGRGRRAAPPVAPAEPVDSAPAAPRPAPTPAPAATMPSEGGPIEGGPVAGGPVAGAPAPAAPADPRQAAIDAARNWPLSDGRTLGAALETLSPPNGNLSPWMAEPQPSGETLVNYFAHGAPGAPTVAYEFAVDSTGKVASRNAAAKAVLTGKAVEPPAPPKRPVHVKVKPKPKAKPKPAAEKPAESLDNLLDEPAGQSGAAASAAESGAGKDAPAPSSSDAAPDAAPAPAPAKSAPAKKQDSLDDLLKE